MELTNSKHPADNFWNLEPDIVCKNSRICMLILKIAIIICGLFDACKFGDVFKCSDFCDPNLFWDPDENQLQGTEHSHDSYAWLSMENNLCFHY